MVYAPYTKLHATDMYWETQQHKPKPTEHSSKQQNKSGLMQTQHKILQQKITLLLDDMRYSDDN